MYVQLLPYHTQFKAGRKKSFYRSDPVSITIDANVHKIRKKRMNQLHFFHLAVSCLDCFADVHMDVKEDCGMHNGCIKRFDAKSEYPP